MGVSTHPGARFRDPQYVLLAQGPPAIANPLKLVDRAVMIIPNPWFADVASLRRHVVGRLDVR